MFRFQEALIAQCSIVLSALLMVQMRHIKSPGSSRELVVSIALLHSASQQSYMPHLPGHLSWTRHARHALAMHDVLSGAQ
jgi:hypothetical protein